MELVLAKMSQPVDWWIKFVFTPIFGGVLCLVGWIVAKKPNAKDLLDKVTPYKGFIGVGMLFLGIWNVITFIPDFSDTLKLSKLMAIGGLGVVISMCLMGFLFGMPQIASWLPGESGAEKKGVELSQKLVKFEVPLGLVAIASAVLLAVGVMTFEMPKVVK
jgi:hypothetical protein